MKVFFSKSRMMGRRIVRAGEVVDCMDDKTAKRLIAKGEAVEYVPPPVVLVQEVLPTAKEVQVLKKSNKKKAVAE